LSQRFDWLTALQFALSGLAILGALGIALLLALAWLTGMVDGPAAPEALTLLLLSASSAFVAILLVPSMVFALLRLLGSDLSRHPLARFRVPSYVWLLLLAPTLGLGYLVSSSAFEPLHYLLPLLHVGAISLPVVWFYAIGSRGLTIGSPQRFWGIFGASLVAGPFLILLLELTMLLGYGLVAVIALSSNPEQLAELTRIAETFQAAPPTLATLQQELAPYLLNPLIAFSILAFGAGFVPLVEEIFKPLGVWLVGQRGITPNQGFAAGALSGAGYAIFESLALGSNAETWFPLVISRGGTGLLHVFTGALVGYGLALGFSRRQYARLVFALLVAIGLHGLWNGLTMISAGSEIYAGLVPADSTLLRFAGVAPYGLIALVTGIFFALVLMNARLSRAA
jgi:hypothetical protein